MLGLAGLRHANTAPWQKLYFQCTAELGLRPHGNTVPCPKTVMFPHCITNWDCTKSIRQSATAGGNQWTVGATAQEKKLNSRLPNGFNRKEVSKLCLLRLHNLCVPGELRDRVLRGRTWVKSHTNCGVRTRATGQIYHIEECRYCHK